MYCRKCGKLLDEDEDFCSKCGYQNIKTVNNQDEIDQIIESMNGGYSSVKSTKDKSQTMIRKKFLKIVIVAVLICAFIEIVAILISKADVLGFKMVNTLILIGVFYSVGITCIDLYEKTDKKIFATFAMAVCILSFVILTLGAWTILKLDYKAIGFFIITTISVCQSALLFIHAPSDESYKKILWITNILIVIVALMFFNILLEEFRNISSLYIRLLSVFAIADITGTIITPILKKIKQ